MRRYGAVIRFREDVSPEEAAQALAAIADKIDLPSFTYDGPHRFKKIDLAGAPVRERARLLLHKYDDENGGPVWYIP